MTQPAGADARPRQALPYRSERSPARLLIDGIAFDPLTESEASEHVMEALEKARGGIIVTPNVDILRLLRQPQYQPIAHRADLVLADGMPVVWASRIAGPGVPARVAGSSLVRTLARDAALRGRSLFLLGGPPRAAEMAAENLIAAYPALRIAGASCPAWNFQDDRDGWDRVVALLRDSRPDIVYLAFGAPKQEHIAMRLAALFPATWFIGCGASVTFLAGLIPQAPTWMQKAGLEWAYRLGREPRRLWRRYLVHDVPYALALLARAVRARHRRHP